MAITKLTSTTSKEFLEANKDSFVVLVFDAEFTGEHEIVQEAITALETAKDLEGQAVIGTVDASENNDLLTELSVLSVPIVVCVAKGKAIRKIDTLEPAKLVESVREELKKYTLLSGDLAEQNADPKGRLNEYLKKLVNRAPVMIFMKGDPKTPRCGFSRQLVEILSKHDVKYETFDILQDEDVRQGLKEFSDWPTYPQIYAKGEFVGGLDILKQLGETGELESTLKT